MTLLLWLTAGMLALLAVPVDLHARASARPAWSWAVQVRWLLGLVRFERDSDAAARPRGRAAPRPHTPAASRDGRRGRSLGRDAAVWRHALGALRGMSRGIEVRRIEADIRLGLGDPADTGCLMGAFLPIAASMRRATIVVVPDFERATFSGRGTGSLRIVPLLVIVPAVSFGLWLSWHAWRAGRGRT